MRKIFLAVSVLLVVSNVAYALEEITVIATRSDTPLSEVISNISVIDSKTLELISANHIQQILSQVPGVNYHRGNGQESLPSIRSAVLTGAGACGNVLILEEGIAVRGAGFCNVNELFDTHFEHANRIEVVRGANTAFYGSNAMLGSINVNLPSVGDNLASLELGANQYSRVKLAMSYGEEESDHGRFYLTVADDGGFRDDSGYQQQKYSWRHNAELGSWNLNLGATGTLLDQQTAGFIVGLDSYRDPELRTKNLDPEAFRKSKSLRAWASFSKKISDQRALKITPYVRITDMDFLQHFLPGDPLEQNQQTGFGWQSSLTTVVSNNLDWTIGFDGELSSGELQQAQDSPTKGSAFLQATIPEGTHYDYKVDAQQLAVFAHTNWQVSTQWKTITGVRLEHISYDYDNLSLDGRTRDDGTDCGFGGCRYSRPADRKDDFTHLSPKLEIQYQTNGYWRWHISLADSFRAPQATELYRLQRQQTVADLKEVRATHFELGATWQNELTKLAVTFYQIQQENVIIRDSDFFNIDGQSIDSQGLEISLNHNFNQHWNARLVTSYAKHEYASDQFINGKSIRGNEVDTAPNLVGSMFLVWQLNDSFSTEAEFQHTSSYFLDAENAHEYPGHTLLNLRSNYKFNDRWSASIRVLNLTNKLYAERADFTSFTDERYFPGETRSLFGELRLKF